MTPREAALEVRALVSGFPGKRAWRRRLFLLKRYQAHVDGSGTGDPRLFVLAGVIAPVENWIAFTKDWQELLDMKPQLEYFKQSEMVKSPVRLERSGWFERVMSRHATGFISCSLRVDDLVKVIRQVQWPPGVSHRNPEILENPYYFAFKAIITKLAAHQRDQLGLFEPIDFIFDDETEKSETLAGWERIKLNVSPDVRKLMGETPIYRDDKKLLPLQAADMFAYWVRKRQLNILHGRPEEPLFPWRQFVPKAATPDQKKRWLHIEFSEDDFRHETEKWIQPEVLQRAIMPDEVVTTTLREIERREKGINITYPDPTSPISILRGSS